MEAWRSPWMASLPLIQSLGAMKEKMDEFEYLKIKNIFCMSKMPYAESEGKWQGKSICNSYCKELIHPIWKDFKIKKIHNLIAKWAKDRNIEFTEKKCKWFFTMWIDVQSIHNGRNANQNHTEIKSKPFPTSPIRQKSKTLTKFSAGKVMGKRMVSIIVGRVENGRTLWKEGWQCLPTSQMHWLFYSRISLLGTSASKTPVQMEARCVQSHSSEQGL